MNNSREITRQSNSIRFDGSEEDKARLKKAKVIAKNYKIVQGQQTERQFWLGDWANHERTQDEDNKPSYRDLSKRIGLAEQTLKNFAYVARALPEEIRNYSLSFGLHKTIAALPEPQEILELAEREDMTVNEVKTYLNGTPKRTHVGTSKEGRTVTVNAVQDDKTSVSEDCSKRLKKLQTQLNYMDAENTLLLAKLAKLETAYKRQNDRIIQGGNRFRVNT